MVVGRICLRGGRLARSWLLGCLAVTIAAVLVAPAGASAAWLMFGKTSQGFAVGLRVSQNLSHVKQLAIRWRAQCATGATLTDTTEARGILVSPFPHFHGTGSYEYTDQSSGQTLSITVTTHLHGRLLRNIRARGTWSTQAVVRDATGNQIDTCSSGLIRWAVHG